MYVEMARDTPGSPMPRPRDLGAGGGGGAATVTLTSGAYHAAAAAAATDTASLHGNALQQKILEVTYDRRAHACAANGKRRASLVYLAINFLARSKSSTSAVEITSSRLHRRKLAGKLSNRPQPCQQQALGWKFDRSRAFQFYIAVEFKANDISAKAETFSAANEIETRQKRDCAAYNASFDREDSSDRNDFAADREALDRVEIALLDLARRWTKFPCARARAHHLQMSSYR